MATCTYLVQTAGTTTILSLVGSASYVNCGQLQAFLNGLEHQGGRTELLVNFRRCTAVDSTILGILSDCALKLTKQEPPCRVIFANIDGRVLEVVKNLGLHHLVEISETPVPPTTGPQNAIDTGMCSTACMLEAHNALIRTHPDNENRFHDVVEALRAQL